MNILQPEIYRIALMTAAMSLDLERQGGLDDDTYIPGVRRVTE